MSRATQIPDTLHLCPDCKDELVSGADAYGAPRACMWCIMRRVRRRYDEPGAPQARRGYQWIGISIFGVAIVLVLWLALIGIWRAYQ